MANAAVAKGSTVEVSSDEPGFDGAWYVATLLDEVPNNNNNEISYLVKYDTLLQDDTLLEPLTEIVSTSCVRPLPPRNLRRNNVNYATGTAAEGGGGGEDFELYDVIDAYHREGWWIGVVSKVINVAGVRKYVVAFENPPEEVEFGRSQLRLHVDWIDGRWQVSPKKIPENKLVERNGRRTSESNNDARSGFATPSKGARTTDVDSPNVGPQPSSVMKSRLRKNTEKSYEMVDDVQASDPSRRIKGTVNSVEQDSRGKGSKGNTKDKASVMEKSRSDATVHQHSPLMEPEMNKITTTPEHGLVARNARRTSESNNDASKRARTTDVDNPTGAPQTSSITKSRARRNNERSSETDGAVKASDPPAGSKGNTQAKASVMEKSRPDAVHQDSPLAEHEMNKITTETCAVEDGQSLQKKKRGRPSKLLAKEPISLQQGGPQLTIDLDDQPPSHSQLAALNNWRFGPRSTRRDEVEPPNQPTVTSSGPDHRDGAGTATDYQQDWPFIKQSPIWATIASLEIYQTPPQRPHFSLLKKIKADHREGLAIAHMVTFGNLVQNLSNLQLTDPIDPINNSLEILTELEAHGFNVGAIRTRLNKFLSLKSKASQHTIKLKKFEEELEKCKGEKCVEEKEINELEMKMKELKEKMEQRVTMKKVKEKEIMGLQSNMDLASEELSDCEVAFKKLAATPL